MPNYEYYQLNNLRKPELLLCNKTIDAFWIYAVYNSFNDLLFVWYGKLNDIVANRPIRSLTCYDGNEMYKVYLLGCKETELDAKNEVNWWIDHSELHGKMPPWNMRYRLYNDNKFIRCIETGEIFRNAREIVKTYGVCQSALSCHLAQKPGYKSVKGMRFVYCDESVTYDDYKAQRRLAGSAELPKQGDVHYETPQMSEIEEWWNPPVIHRS